MKKSLKSIFLLSGMLTLGLQAVELKDATNQQLLNELESRLQGTPSPAGENIFDISASADTSNYVVRVKIYNESTEREETKSYSAYISAQHVTSTAAAINQKAPHLKSGGVIGICRSSSWAYDVVKLRFTRQGNVLETIEQFNDQATCINTANALNAVP